MRWAGLFGNRRQRSELALLYSYLFPTIFLTVFWVLYRPMCRISGTGSDPGAASRMKR